MRRECNEFDGARLRVLLAELDDELTSGGLSEPCRIGFVGGAAVAEPEVVFVGTNLIVEAASPACQSHVGVLAVLVDGSAAARRDQVKVLFRGVGAGVCWLGFRCRSVRSCRWFGSSRGPVRFGGCR